MSVRKSNCPLFTLCTSLLAGVVLSACLDIPSEPSTSGKAKTLSVYIIQKDKKDSSLVKINTQDSATFVAQVKPSTYEKDLTYTWYHDDEELSQGKTYSDLFIIDNLVPNRVVVLDKEGNQFEKTFEPILNTPPRIGATFFPADSSKFTITEFQTIEFKWYIFDIDDSNLDCTLTIDNKEYNVGSLTTISQSGFEPGWHSFSILVSDSLGEKASTPTRHFQVLAPSEDE